MQPVTHSSSWAGAPATLADSPAGGCGPGTEWPGSGDDTCEAERRSRPGSQGTAPPKQTA